MINIKFDLTVKQRALERLAEFVENWYEEYFRPDPKSDVKIGLLDVIGFSINNEKGRYSIAAVNLGDGVYKYTINNEWSGREHNTTGIISASQSVTFSRLFMNGMKMLKKEYKEDIIDKKVSTRNYVCSVITVKSNSAWSFQYCLENAPTKAFDFLTALNLIDSFPYKIWDCCINKEYAFNYGHK